MGAIGFFAAGLLAYPILTSLTHKVNQAPSISITPKALSPTPQAHKSDADNLKVCFTPNQSCLPQVLHYIDNAKSSIVLLGYSFTSKPMADSLIRAKNRGVKVRMVLDHSQRTQKYSKEPIEALLARHIEVRFDHSVKIAHNKIIVIDGYQTVTGSYNWTHSAEFKNAENLVFISSPAVTKQYADYFETRWKVSQPPIKGAGHTKAIVVASSKIKTNSAKKYENFTATSLQNEK